MSFTTNRGIFHSYFVRNVLRLDLRNDFNPHYSCYSYEPFGLTIVTILTILIMFGKKTNRLVCPTRYLQLFSINLSASVVIVVALKILGHFVVRVHEIRYSPHLSLLYAGLGSRYSAERLHSNISNGAENIFYLFVSPGVKRI